VSGKEDALTSCCLQELLNKFREKKVDFAAHTNTEDGSAVFLNLLGVQHPTSRSLANTLNLFMLAY